MTQKEKRREYARAYYAKTKKKVNQPEASTNNIADVIRAYKTFLNATEDEKLKDDITKCLVKVVIENS